MIPGQRETPAPGSGGTDKFDDDQYPAYTMGRAAEMIGATQGFLRSLDEAASWRRSAPPAATAATPATSSVSPRVRELVDHGTGLDAACRIVTLEDQLHEAQRENTELRSAE